MSQTTTETPDDPRQEVRLWREQPLYWCGDPTHRHFYGTGYECPDCRWEKNQADAAKPVFAFAALVAFLAASLLACALLL